MTATARERAAASVVEAGRAVRDDVVELRSALARSIEHVEGRLRLQLRRDPYTTLAALAGVGYVLGGGLPSLLTRRLLGMGGWMVLEQVVSGLRAADAPRRA
jgi:hypothetical protein